MAKRRLSRRFDWALWVGAGVLATCAALPMCAQDIMLPTDDYTPNVKKPKPRQDVLPVAPTQAPALTIPVASLGYGAPSRTYLGRHYSLLSLDFLDDDRLLFTFRAPGLLPREANDVPTDYRMKAVVLALPDGKAVSEAVWTLSDRMRYLWVFRDGQFLLRDRDGFEIGDSSLKVRPLFRAVGQFLSVDVDPAQKVLAAKSSEPGSSDVTVRIVDRASGQIRQTNQFPAAQQFSINSQGQLGTVHNKYDKWSFTLNAFDGGSKVLAHFDSNCVPNAAFIGDEEILVAGCNNYHIPKLTAVSSSGQVVWDSEMPVSYLTPLLVVGAKRFVRESILFKKPLTATTATTWVKVVKGQVVRVYESYTGKLLLEVPVSPVLDGGGNVAISPNGQRIAVLNNGSIQVFEVVN
ncbi:MAG TPA: hypothetical protein VHZ28_15255 [Terracidiphilus sp.]|nr:hypothetical protein [Terracidiphilus sp.]